MGHFYQESSELSFKIKTRKTSQKGSKKALIQSALICSIMFFKSI